MQEQPTTASSLESADAIAEAHGFYLLGNITLGADGKVVFPKPPMGGGLYFITIHAGGNYIGEGKSYGSEVGADGKQTFGRFKNYTDPADDIWTELVINVMLKKGSGGKVYLLPMIGGKAERKALERSLINDFRKRSVLLWNTGIGRDEKIYWSYKMPIFENTYAYVVPRYTARAELTPYATKRLANLHRWARVFRAKAKALGLYRKDYVGANGNDAIIAEPPAAILKSFGVEGQAQEPNQAIQKTTRERRGAVFRQDHPSNAVSIQDLVHDYRARHPDAGREQLIREALPSALQDDVKALSTVRTLYGDFSMTLEALASDSYVAGERETLTSRRSVCRLWKQHADNVTAKMVEKDLMVEGHQRNAGSIQQITTNVKSTLRALEAAGKL